MWTRVALAAVLGVGSAHLATAFERDTHYYSTFALALTSCFEWREAHLIASADVMVDGSRGTVAELDPAKRHNKAAWHAFGHSAERYYELWERVTLEQREAERLVAFGQFLHYLQDWEAHAGYPVHLGHAKATLLGHDPDSMAKSEPRTRHSVQATLDHMALVCEQLGRLPDGTDNSDEAVPELLGRVHGNRLVQDLIELSDPAWRKTLKGGLTEHGAEIMAENIRRVEQYVLEEIAPLPAKNVPADFQPGSDELGIPEPLELDFEADGRIASHLPTHVERAGLHPEDDHLDPADHHVRVVQARPKKDGWRVQVDVTNVGDKPMPSGELLAIVVDALSDETLGQATVDVPEVAPDETIKLKLTVPTTRPSETALIGVSVDTRHDRDPYNSDIWHISAEDLEELEDHVAAYGHLHGSPEIPDNAVLETRTPRVWLTSAGLLCTSHVARGTSDDPTWHMEPLQFSLRGGDGKLVAVSGVNPPVWTVTPFEPGRIAAVKSFACFDPQVDLCPHLAGLDAPPVLESTIRFGSIEESVAVELAEHVGPICRPAS
jgi:hypothetical protein